MTSLLFLLALAGCGFYSVRFEPPRPPAPAVRRLPLDLSISLGEVASYTYGKPEVLDAASLGEIDASFMRAVTRAGIVRAALPRGTTTDLYYDTVRRLRLSGTPSYRRSYQILTAPLALGIPGFPYPWDLHVERSTRLWGEIRGERVLLRENRLRYAAEVWGKSYWAVLMADRLRDVETDYLVAYLARALDRDRPRFEQFEAAVKAGDVAAARRLAVDPLPGS